jgi:hypothetical protein
MIVLGGSDDQSTLLIHVPRKLSKEGAVLRI